MSVHLAEHNEQLLQCVTKNCTSALAKKQRRQTYLHTIASVQQRIWIFDEIKDIRRVLMNSILNCKARCRRVKSVVGKNTKQNTYNSNYKTKHNSKQHRNLMVNTKQNQLGQESYPKQRHN